MAMRKMICRLCLDYCDNSFEVLEVSLKQYLDILFIKIDLSISEEPVICTNCAITLKNSVDFKSMAHRMQHFLIDFVEGKVKLSPRDIYLNKNRDAFSITEIDKLCKICLMQLNSSSVSSLDNEENVTVQQTMLKRCLPEWDLKVKKKPAICASCLDSSQICHNFVMNCLHVEETVKKYCRIRGVNSNNLIKLKDVVQFITKNVCKDDEEEVRRIKVEGKFPVEEVEVEYKNDNFTETGNPEFHSVLQLPSNNTSRCKEDVDKVDRIETETLFFEEGENEVEYKNENDIEMEDQKLYNQHFSSNLMSVEDDNKANVIKFEDTCLVETQNGVELKNGNFMEVVDQKFPLCNNEEIEIKSDQDDFDSAMSSTRADLMLQHHRKTSATSVSSSEICANAKVHKNRLGIHKPIQKGPSSMKMYQCETCLYQTKYKSLHQRHMLAHKNSSKKKCTSGKLVRNKQNIKAVMSDTC